MRLDKNSRLFQLGPGSMANLIVADMVFCADWSLCWVQPNKGTALEFSMLCSRMRSSSSSLIEADLETIKVRVDGFPTHIMFFTQGLSIARTKNILSAVMAAHTIHTLVLCQGGQPDLEELVALNHLNSDAAHHRQWSPVGCAGGAQAGRIILHRKGCTRVPKGERGARPHLAEEIFAVLHEDDLKPSGPGRLDQSHVAALGVGLKSLSLRPVKVIGRGGYGLVMSAVSRAPGQPEHKVAVKIT